MPHKDHLQVAVREFARHKELADRALAQVTGELFFTPLDDGDNSIAIIVKHMAGNMKSRWRDFLTSDGEKPDRNRDAEFELGENDTREALMAVWESGWRRLFDALEPLGDADVDTLVSIRGEELTVLQAVDRQLTHYAYHIGQLVLMAKHFAGDEWVSLSVPKGKSSEFNANPKRYLEGKDSKEVKNQ